MTDNSLSRYEQAIQSHRAARGPSFLGRVYNGAVATAKDLYQTIPRGSKVGMIVGGLLTLSLPGIAVGGILGTDSARKITKQAYEGVANAVARSTMAEEYAEIDESARYTQDPRSNPLVNFLRSRLRVGANARRMEDLERVAKEHKTTVQEAYVVSKGRAEKEKLTQELMKKTKEAQELSRGFKVIKRRDGGVTVENGPVFMSYHERMREVNEMRYALGLNPYPPAFHDLYIAIMQRNAEAQVNQQRQPPAGGGLEREVTRDVTATPDPRNTQNARAQTQQRQPRARPVPRNQSPHNLPPGRYRINTPGEDGGEETIGRVDIGEDGSGEYQFGRVAQNEEEVRQEGGYSLDWVSAMERQIEQENQAVERTARLSRENPERIINRVDKTDYPGLEGKIPVIVRRFYEGRTLAEVRDELRINPKKVRRLNRFWRHLEEERFS